MNTFRKSVIAIATVATVAVAAAAPAQAGSKWKKGLAAGVGVGVGLGIAGAILGSRQRTVVVQQPTYVVQPTCYTTTQQYYDQYGILRARTVQHCN